MNGGEFQKASHDNDRFFLKAFHSKHLDIDEKQWVQIKHDLKYDIQLKGDGEAYQMTSRALRRLGYRISNETELCCEIKMGI